MRYPLPQAFAAWADWGTALLRALDRSTEPAPLYCPPSALTVGTGTLTSGTAADLVNPGGTSVVITEVSGTPGFQAEVAFRGLTRPIGVVVFGYYQGNSAHDVYAEVYNYASAAWDAYIRIPSGTVLVRYTFLLGKSENYVRSNVAKLRFTHASSGSAGHTLTLDYCAFMCMRGA